MRAVDSMPSISPSPHESSLKRFGKFLAHTTAAWIVALIARAYGRLSEYC
jgi:hypothetical protein